MIATLWKIIDFLEKYNGATTAVATVFIAIFTIVLAYVTRRQAKLTQKTIDLAREEFIASHRPRIRVRFIQGPFEEPDAREVAYVTIVNTGETRGTIYAVGIDFARREVGGNWLPPGLAASAKPIDPIVLKSGERHTFEARTQTPTGDAEIFGYAVGSHEMCAVGVFRYRDDNGTNRETAFFRIFDGLGNGFVASKNDEDEYED